MKFGRIFARGVALGSSSKGWVRSLGPVREEMALRGAFTTAWRQMMGSRPNRFERKCNFA